MVEWACRSTSPVSVPRASPGWLLPLPGSLPRLASRPNPSLLSNFCLCAGTKSVWDFACTLESGVSVPTALQLSYVQVPLAFKPSHPGDSFSRCRTPGWEVQCGPQTPQCLRRTSPWIPLSFWLWIACLGLWPLSIKCLCPAYLSYGSFFISTVIGNRFCIIDSCSVDSCNFGFPVGED